jgi:hypothetical protein
MPRNVRSPETLTPRRPSRLVEELAEELRSGRESGQPIIDEDRFKTGSIRVVVLWDRWDDIDPESRSAAIVEAYRKVEGEEFAGRIALVNGLTIPEAIASGMLPVKIIAALREDDPVTPEQCRQAMIDEGASTLLDDGYPELRYATEEEADAGRKRLAARLPGSEPVWVVIKEPSLTSKYHWDYSE